MQIIHACDQNKLYNVENQDLHVYGTLYYNFSLTVARDEHRSPTVRFWWFLTTKPNGVVVGNYPMS
jgi:hypothetical protein